jgi:hypothetical protein
VGLCLPLCDRRRRLLARARLVRLAQEARRAGAVLAAEEAVVAATADFWRLSRKRRPRRPPKPQPVGVEAAAVVHRLTSASSNWA